MTPATRIDRESANEKGPTGDRGHTYSISRRGLLRSGGTGIMAAIAGCTDGLQRSFAYWRSCPEPPAPSDPVETLLPQPEGDWIQLTKRQLPQLDAEEAIQAQYRGPFNGRHLAHISRWPRIHVHEIRKRIRAGELGSFDIWVWREQHVFAAKTSDSVRQLPTLLGLSPALTHECVVEHGESGSRQLADRRPRPRELD